MFAGEKAVLSYPLHPLPVFVRKGDDPLHYDSRADVNAMIWDHHHLHASKAAGRPELLPKIYILCNLCLGLLVYDLTWRDAAVVGWKYSC